jgi:hypothetical protein
LDQPIRRTILEKCVIPADGICLSREFLIASVITVILPPQVKPISNPDRVKFAPLTFSKKNCGANRNEENGGRPIMWLGRANVQSYLQVAITK